MRNILVCFLLCINSGTSLACPEESDLQKSAAQDVYDDTDARDYICGIGEKCDFIDFFSKIKIQNINLNEPGITDKEGIVIEPINSGLQFFSAVFLKKNCNYKMIFSPDVSMSGIKPLNVYRNGFPILRAVERESTIRWNESDFSFVPKIQAYSELKKRCYTIKNNSGSVTQIECK